MKEVREWDNNPRVMWVWDHKIEYEEGERKQREDL